MKKSLLFVIMLCFVMLSSGGTANAATRTEWKGVGYWHHGRRFTKVVSEYTSHNSRYEGHASTIDGRGQYVSGGWKPSNLVSDGSQYTSSTGNSTYYKYRSK